MAMHKKFTFDDPEDSYWNENGQKSNNFFDDVGSRQVAARAAMANLFDADSPFAAGRVPPKQPGKGPLGGQERGGRGDGPASVSNTSPYGGGSSGKTDSFNTSTRRLSFDQQMTPTIMKQAVEQIGSTSMTDEMVTSTTTEIGEKIGGAVIGGDTVFSGFATAVLPVRMSTASLVSECSASSLPSEANKLDLDYNRLRAEHRKLQKHLETVRNDRFRALDVSDAVRRMLTGETVSLDLYKSKEDKMKLLDAAIAIVDHHVILAVLYFLKSTLMETFFRDILLRKSEAAEVYIEHLKTTRDIPELTTTLFALGRNCEAAMIELAGACKTRDVTSRIAAVKRCLTSSFSDPTLSTEAALVSDHINMMERQLEIEDADKKAAPSHALMKQFPPRAGLAGQSTIATLYYSCLYHFDLPHTNCASPQSLSSLLRISEKEFVWTAVSALVRQSRWPDIERVLQNKGVVQTSYARGLLNRAGISTKLSCPFSWRNLFRVLHSNGIQPPKDFLARVLRSVTDDEERLKLAHKAHVTEIVIESLVSTREREKLAAYAATLTQGSPDAFKALQALNNTSIKWKS
ncbi:spe-39 [Pristionchus pacificus]|uniref:Spe-39 n=1 Tax=Pristionchus pacificus TaxID=54126 RepID=A0A2A6CAK3_PRIPA|nr:spe-39 [Pristionchus pacificus]|eukprot:PDM75083.1 spe-39 [Pristionchus pacificus]